MVVREFSRFLKSEGAEPLKTVGERFDPNLHEAIEQVETEKESENNVILEELQKGYLLNGRLLRPAKVKVAKLKSEGFK
jgi:molecular chaperone GrpE